MILKAKYSWHILNQEKKEKKRKEKRRKSIQSLTEANSCDLCHEVVRNRLKLVLEICFFLKQPEEWIIMVRHLPMVTRPGVVPLAVLRFTENYLHPELRFT